MSRAARTWGVFWYKSKMPDLFGVILQIKRRVQGSKTHLQEADFQQMFIVIKSTLSHSRDGCTCFNFYLKSGNNTHDSSPFCFRGFVLSNMRALPTRPLPPPGRGAHDHLSMCVCVYVYVWCALYMHVYQHVCIHVIYACTPTFMHTCKEKRTKRNKWMDCQAYVYTHIYIHT